MTRIVAGRGRGRRLAAPTGDTTRPTTDRVKEAAFNAIASWLGAAGEPDDALAGLSFLDLYAGSGAIGIEAASRGAGPVTCVEADARIAAVARRNADESGLGVTVVTTKVESYLAQEPRGHDIVWLDPPYAVANDRLEAVLQRLGAGWLAPDGLVVVERSSRTPPFGWADSVGESWNRRYGETTLYFGVGRQP